MRKSCQNPNRQHCGANQQRTLLAGEAGNKIRQLLLCFLPSDGIG